MVRRGWPPSTDGKKCIIGMIHLLPLPGSPLGARSLDEVIAQAVADARALEAGGVDAALVQNRGDRAFTANVAPADVIAAMGGVVREVVQSISMPVGIHVLRNDTVASLAVAHITGGRFVRAAVLTSDSPSAQGRLEGNPHALLRYRRAIGADDVTIFADVASMHNKQADADAPEAAADAVFFGAADAVIVARPSPEDAIALTDTVRARVDVPVLLGGYTSRENITRLLQHADGAIVGEAFERQARQAGVDVEQVRNFVRALHG